MYIYKLLETHIHIYILYMHKYIHAYILDDIHTYIYLDACINAAHLCINACIQNAAQTTADAAHRGNKESKR